MGHPLGIAALRTQYCQLFERIATAPGGFDIILPRGPVSTCHCYLVKRAVDVYAVILQVAGFVTLGLYGASQVQRQDPRGAAVLAILVGGLVLTLAYVWGHYRRVRSTRRMAAGKSFRAHTFHSSATAEYGHAPAIVWELIRPAEAAILIDGAAHAFKVPGTPDGEGERQCFISADGRVSVIEVVSEVPGRSAVTRAVCSPDHPVVETTYTLAPIAAGCRLTMQTLIELPVPMTAAQQQEIRAHDRSFLVKVGHLLDRQSVQEVPTTSSGG